VAELLVEVALVAVELLFDFILELAAGEGISRK
jgi:hypothetical protein